MADYKREPAIRLFAAEIAKTTEELERNSDEKFAPVYAVSPTGAKINRIFHIGTLTEIEEGDNDFVRGRVVDPTGTVHIRAGTYHPEISAVMRQLAGHTPTFVAVTGKLNIYQPADGQAYVSIRPESITQVTETERELWMAETTMLTLARIRTLVTSPEKLLPEVKAVIDDRYGTDLGELKNIVKVAAGIGAGENGAGKETGGKPEPVPAPQKETAPKKAGKTQPGKPAEKVPASSPVPADKTKTGTGIDEDKVKAAHKLLAELCTSSENGTVSAKQFDEKLKELNIASAETASAVVKGLFTAGMVYEPMMGRLRVVV
jgi:hypothetical protein